MASNYFINNNSLSNICDVIPSHVPESWKTIFSTNHFTSSDTNYFTDEKNTTERFCLKDSFLLNDGTYLPNWGYPGYET